MQKLKIELFTMHLEYLDEEADLSKKVPVFGPAKVLPWSEVKGILLRSPEILNGGFFSMDGLVNLNTKKKNYWKAFFIFIFLNPDNLKIHIELMPYKAKNYPIIIEVGLWGRAPAEI